VDFAPATFSAQHFGFVLTTQIKIRKPVRPKNTPYEIVDRPNKEINARLTNRETRVQT